MAEDQKKNNQKSDHFQKVEDTSFNFKAVQARMTECWNAGIRPDGYEPGPSADFVEALKGEIDHLRKLVDKLVGDAQTP